MVQPLHPRSSWTLSLFTTTLAISFLVVGMPHILPCPVPSRPLAEGDIYIDRDGRRRRRKAAPTAASQNQGHSVAGGLPSEEGDAKSGQEVLDEARRRARECPVPKPRGLVGQLMGFKKEDEQLGGDLRVPVRVEPIQRRRRADADGDGAG
ncbi:MAG: hypothetical protein INR71_13910 [Terriglobus roseus]|nr:hypothetical protein [Terriglobus roseus]